jgi:hypothetical protein
MKRFIIIMATIAVALAMFEVPASAAAPATSIVDVTDYGSGSFYFAVHPASGWVSACDKTSIQIDALGVTYGYDDVSWIDVLGGSPGYYRDAEVDFDLAAADPALQPSASDLTIKIACTVRWRTSQVVRRMVYRSSYVNGVRTASRSQAPYSLGGNCNYLGSGGELLVTCLFARSTQTYVLHSPRRTRIVGGSVGMKPGLFPCHTSVRKTYLNPRSMRFIVTTANPGGFAQCSVKWVGIRYRGSHRVTVWTTHAVNVQAATPVATTP